MEMKKQRNIRRNNGAPHVAGSMGCLSEPIDCHALPTTTWGKPPANISGTAADQTGAVIPNAAVTLTNAQTGDMRKHSRTAQACSISPQFQWHVQGDYCSDGFSTYVATDIIVHSGESHVIPNIQLPMQQANVDVE